MQSPKVILFIGDDADRLRLVESAARGVGAQVVAGDAIQRFNGPIALAVAEVDPQRMDEVERFQQLARGLGSAVLAWAPSADAEEVRRLFRAGAADVITGRSDVQALAAAFHESMDAIADAPMRQGGVISVVKGCGGAGATTLALNLAALLAQGDEKKGRPSRSTAVLDLDLQFGDAALALDLTPRSTIVDVLRAQQRVDGRFVQSVMTEHESGLRLLAGPSGVVPLDAIDGEFAVRLVDHASAGFERTVVDLPTSWTDWTVPILQRSDIIALVTTPTVAGAYGARRVLDALADAGVERPVFLVLNKLTGVIDAFEKPSRIGKSLQMGVDAALGLDSAAVKASDRGQLVVEAFGGARISKDLRALARKLDERVEALYAGVAFSEMAA